MKKMKKALSILLCLCMLVQNCPVMAFAATTDNLCKHHTEHTPECGYGEGSAGSDCTHEHSEDCYEILECRHTCGDACGDPCAHECTIENGCITMEPDCCHVHGDCGYSEGTTEVPCSNADTNPECDHSGDCGYAPATEGTPCTHVCEVKVDSDDSCYKLLCSHADGGHDDACGYAEAVEGHPCHYECAECAASEEPAPVCDCGTDDALIHATTCPVYVAPENPQCYCAEKCTEANVWCDICGFDYAKCGGTGRAVGYNSIYEFSDGNESISLDDTIVSISGDDENVVYSVLALPDAGASGTVAVYGYNGTASEIIVPGIINLVTSSGDSFSFIVTAIAENAFRGNSALTSITLPETVETIGNSAFKGCKNLASINLDSVDSLDNNAFKGTQVQCITHKFGLMSGCLVCDFICDHPVVKGNGVCTTCDMALAALADGKYYETLQEAFDAVPSGDNTLSVILLKDTTESVTLSQDASIRMDGHSISALTINGCIVEFTASEILKGGNVEQVTVSGDVILGINSDVTVKNITLSAANLRLDMTKVNFEKCTVIMQDSASELIVLNLNENYRLWKQTSDGEIAPGTTGPLSGPCTLVIRCSHKYEEETHNWANNICNGSCTLCKARVSEKYSVTTEGRCSVCNAQKPYTLTLQPVENGKVYLYNTLVEDTRQVPAGSQVALQVSSDTGYVLDTLTVTDSKNNILYEYPEEDTDDSGAADEAWLELPNATSHEFQMPADNVTVAVTFTACTEHIGGTATCTKQAICEICGADYGSLDADSHSWENGECTGCGAPDPTLVNPVLDISKGRITVEDGKITQSPEYENQPYSGVLTITGTSSSNTVTVNSGNHNIVLKDCRISSTTSAAFTIASYATVDLTLDGTNTLSSGASYAGLAVPEGAQLVVSGYGSLTATGGASAAGIGGGCGENGGIITIHSGTVTAKGGDSANNNGGGAGIGGGGCYNKWAGTAGNVTITGGTVMAAAGTVANPSLLGFDIGRGGSSSLTQPNTGTVTITGGNIKASAVFPLPTDADGNELSLVTITLTGASDGDKPYRLLGSDNSQIAYNISDSELLDTAKLFVYLPVTNDTPAVSSVIAGEYQYNKPEEDPWDSASSSGYSATFTRQAGQFDYADIRKENVPSALRFTYEAAKFSGSDQLLGTFTYYNGSYESVTLKVTTAGDGLGIHVNDGSESISIPFGSSQDIKITLLSVDTDNLVPDAYANVGSIRVMLETEVLAEVPVEVMLVKVLPEGTPPTAKTLIYTGEAQELVTAGTTEEKAEAMRYSLDNLYWSLAIPTGTNAGKYTVYYRVPGNRYFEEITSTDVEVTILPKEVTAPTFEDIKVNSTEPLDITFKLMDGDTEIPESEYTASYSETATPGTAIITVTDKDGGNYIVSGTKEFSPCDHSGHIGDYAVTADIHRFICSVCEETITEAHTMDTATGECVCDYEMAEASVTMGETVTYYETLPAAVTAAQSSEKSTLTLLKDIDLGDNDQIISSGVFTLDLNGKSLEGSTYGLYIENAKVIITDSQEGGTVSGECQGVLASNSTVTISGGTVSGDSQNGVVAFNSTVTISGGTVSGKESGVHAFNGSTVTISSGTVSSEASGVLAFNGSTVTISGGSISGGVNDIYSYNASVKLTLAEDETVGATFPDGITVIDTTLAEILGEGVSYWAEVDGKDTMLSVAGSSTEITGKGDITIKATCTHSGNTSKPADAGEGKHSLTCTVCNNTITEDHTFDSTTGQCVCGLKRPSAVVTAPAANAKSIEFMDVSLPDGLMYNSRAQELIVPGEADGGTMVYSLDADGDFTEDIPTAVNAGTYTVYYKVRGDETHADTNVDSISVTIQKATVILSTNDMVLCMDYDLNKLASGFRNWERPYYDYNWIPYPTVDLQFDTNAPQGVPGIYDLFLEAEYDEENFDLTCLPAKLEVTDHHLFNIYTEACECGMEAVAKLVNGDTTTYYATADEAFADAVAARSGVVTIRKDAQINEDHETYQDISVVVEDGATLTLNNTLHVRGELSGTGTLTANGTYEVITYLGGEIRDITFLCGLHNEATIYSGTFHGTVENRGGTITGGTFNGKLINENMLMSGSDEIESPGTIINTTPGSFELGDDFIIENRGGTINCTAHIWKDGTCRLCAIGCSHIGGDAVDNKDGTHTYVCTVCGVSVKEVHVLCYAADDAADTITESCDKECGHTGTVALSAEDKTYDGKAAEITITKIGLLEDTDIPVTFTRNGEVFAGDPVNPGSYSASITLSGETVSVTFTIAKAVAGIVTDPSENELTYNGEALELVTGGITDDGTMVYSLTENGRYSESIPALIYAGDYTVWYYVQGDANHIDSEKAYVEVTIKKAPLTVSSAVVADKSYDGSTHADVTEVTLDGMKSSDVLTMGTDFAATAVFDDANAGTNKSVTVTAALQDTAAAKNYRLVSDAVAATATITPKSVPMPTIILSFSQAIYTGEALRPTVTVMDGDTLIPGDAYTVTYINNVNAGTATACIEVKDGSNYEVAGYSDFIIQKAAAKVSAAPEALDLTYTGQAQKLVTGGTADGGTMVYSLTEVGQYTADITTGIDTGTYTVWYYVQGDANHTDSAKASVKATISKADPVIGTVGCDMALFDSTAVSDVVLTRTDNSIPGTLVLTNTELTTGAGTYNWKFTPADGDNYNTITGTVELTVTADVLETITASGNLKKDSYSYGDSFSIDGLTITAIYTSGITEDVTGLVSFDSTLAAGQPYVELTYQGKTCTITGFTVAKKQLVIGRMAWDIPENAVYSGTAYNAVLTGNLPEGVTVTKTGDTATNAGNYTVKAVFSLAEGYSADNYEIVNGADLTADWTIARKNISDAQITLGTALTYNGKQQTQDVASVKIDGLTVTYAVSGNTGTDAKGYTMTVTGNGNFEGTATADWSIARKNISGAAITLGDSLTYNGSTQTQEVTEVRIGDLNATYDVTANKQVNAGNYTLTVTGNGNFEGSATSDWSIAKARLTITANDNSITYGDVPAANGVTGTGFVGSERIEDLSGELTYSYNYEQFGNVGTYKITPSGVTSGNYEITFADGALTVNTKAITVTADAVSKTYGEADPALTCKVEGLVNGDELTGELKRAAGENVGSYDIEQNTLTAGNNYRLIYTGAKLTINAKAITAADVKLNGSLTYNGKEQTQPITVAEGITYDVSGNKATKAGDYVLTVRGTGNYTGEVKLRWAIGACTHSGNTNGDDNDCSTEVACSVCEVVLVAAKAHRFTDKASDSLNTAADCTNAATYFVRCDNCTKISDTITVSAGSALGHAWTVTYTWSADGKDCTAAHICGKDAKHNETAKASVTSAVTTEATCIGMGTTTYTAEFSVPWAAVQTKDVTDIPAAGHAHTPVIMKPTCTQQGYTTYVCHCGDRYVADYTDAIGHRYDDDWDTVCNNCDQFREIENVPMYRLYNPNTGEHFYTGSIEERENLVDAGWNYEGVAWNAPVYIGEPVHRFYNPNTGDHHYTMDADECAAVSESGWVYEGVAWNSASEKGVPQYRLFNPNAVTGAHNYTSSEEERDHLISLGWIYEGIGWYGMRFQ